MILQIKKSPWAFKKCLGITKVQCILMSLQEQEKSLHEKENCQILTQVFVKIGGH